MSKCKDCHKEIICETQQSSECVSYEGFIPENSPLFEECTITLKEVVEDLYTSYGAEGVLYYAGEGLDLNNNTFSVKYGTTSGTSLEGSWRPMWEDIVNRPSIPEQVNIIAGDNVTVTGTYPNIVINSEASSEDRVNIVGGNNVTVSGSYPNFTISATYTPTTHTGDVTGTTNLTITNSAVTNQKLANMPANTIKGRQDSSGTPQDLTPQQAKEVIGVRQRTIVTTPSQGNYTLVLDRELTTGIFLDRLTLGLTIPNGQFEGQCIHVCPIDSVDIQGSFIDWVAGNGTVISQTKVSGSFNLFWSPNKNAWLISRRNI